MSHLKTTFILLLGVIVIRYTCERMSARTSYLASVDVKRILREKIYDKMLKLGASYSEHVSSSEIVLVSTEGVEQLETYFGKYLPQLFYSLLAPITLFIILCRVNFKASINLCSSYSYVHCRCTEVCEKNIKQLLVYLYRTR